MIEWQGKDQTFGGKYLFGDCYFQSMFVTFSPTDSTRDGSLFHTVLGAFLSVISALMLAVSASAVQFTEGRVSIAALNFYR